MTRSKPDNAPVRKFSEFDESNNDLFVSHIEFDAPIPFFTVHSQKDFDFEELYSIPTALAYYAATHRGWSNKGDDNKREQGKQELRNQLKRLLSNSGD